MKLIVLIVTVVIISTQLLAQENYEMSGHLGSGANSNQQFMDRRPKAVKNLHDRPAENAALLGISNSTMRSKETNKRIIDLVKQKLFALEKLREVTRDSATNKIISCIKCSGTGLYTCNQCSGQGSLDCRVCSALGAKPCVACDGVGANSGLTCNVCSGKGYSTCRTCEGKGKKMCFTCTGIGSNLCSDCMGAGQQLSNHQQPIPKP